MSSALDALDDGRGSFLLIAGEPGIGKSALLAAAVEQAAARWHRVLSGHATEFERGMPFSVLVDALDAQLAELDDRLERMGVQDRDVLATIFPALRGAPIPAPEP